MNDFGGGAQTGFEFSYDGKTFEVGVMDIFAQKRIATKIAPFIVPLAKLYMSNPALIAELAAASKGDGTAGNERTKAALDFVIGNFESLSKLLSEMPDEVSDALMISCFKVIKIKRPGGVGWEAIWNDAAGCLQYDDLNDLMFAGVAISAVIRSRLKSFFPSGPTT